MEDSLEPAENLICYGCLCSSNEYRILDYKIQHPHFRAIFEVDSIKLCCLCKRMAQHAELFIQNVQSNQILMESFGYLPSAIQEVHSQLQPPITLNLTHLDAVNLSGTNSTDTGVTESYISYPKVTVTYSKKALNGRLKRCKKSKEVNIKLNGSMEAVYSSDHHKNNIKLELKEEQIVFDHLEGEFVDDNDEFQDTYVKEEDDFPLQDLLKEEIQLEDLEVLSLRKTLRKKKVKKKGKPKNIKREIKEPKVVNYNDASGIETIYITEEQCLEERKQQALDKKYLNCTFKCEDCLKGFNFKASYELHKEKHSPAMGEFECDICKLRMDTDEKLQSHKRYHTIRYKCTECGILRISRITIKDHFGAYHTQGEKQYVCPYCSKAFKRQVSQRKHIRYTHLKKERVTCAYCHKSYANKDVLKSHMMVSHPKEVSANEVVRRYVCQDCGMAFKSPSQLRNHGTKHSLTRDYYCVECDKAFKSEAVLKQHLKTAQPHINYLELPLSCPHCDKKFAIRRDLDRHMNRVHLDIKPFRCDKCDKAYVNNWSLIDHKRHVHEGYKRPLRYPCKMCDKIFDRGSILKAHIRTHTGERPYQCSKCPAQFSQSGVLATHDKLIHLKLTRDGRPKPNSMK